MSLVSAMMFMLTVIVCLIALFLALLVLFNKKRNAKQPTGLVYEPPALPLVGHALDLAPEKFLDTADMYYTKYGKVVSVWAFFQRMIFIGDIAAVKELLAKRPKVFRRPTTLDYAGNVLGYNAGLFHNHGPNWNRIRKLTSPTLAKHYIQQNIEDMCKEALRMVDHIGMQADGKSVVDVRHEMFLYTLHVIIHGAFGVEMTGEFEEYFFGTQFCKDIFGVFRFMMESAMFPAPDWVWRAIPYFHQFELTAREGNARFSCLAQRIIDQKRRELAENPKGGNRHSVIDIMIREETEGAAGLATDDEVMANVKTFFVAGSETTSVVLSWALYLLCQDREILGEAQKEVAAAAAAGCFGNTRQDKPSASLTKEELWTVFSAERMPLTHAVIKETLRLYTPGSMVFDELESEYSEGYTLSSNGLVIQPKDCVVLNFDAIHWDEENFPQGRSFVPRRWLTTDAAALARMEGCYFAFGGGTRQCPGINLALTEAVIGLSALLHHFDWELACPREEIKRVMTFTAAPTKMPMTFTKRR